MSNHDRIAMKSGSQGSRRCVEFKCHTPDDCAIAGYCIPSMENDPRDDPDWRPGVDGEPSGLDEGSR